MCVASVCKHEPSRSDAEFKKIFVYALWCSEIKCKKKTTRTRTETAKRIYTFRNSVSTLRLQTISISHIEKFAHSKLSEKPWFNHKNQTILNKCIERSMPQYAQYSQSRRLEWFCGIVQIHKYECIANTHST